MVILHYTHQHRAFCQRVWWGVLLTVVIIENVCFRKLLKVANSRNDRRWAVETVSERGNVKIVSENVWRRGNEIETVIVLGARAAATGVGIVIEIDRTGAAGAPVVVAARRDHDRVANHTVPGISYYLVIFGCHMKYSLSENQQKIFGNLLLVEFVCWSQWPHGPRCGLAAAHLVRVWVRIPPGSWMFVCCGCCVLLGRGLCDGLITHPEEFYWLWRVVMSDLETSWMRRPWPTVQPLHQKQANKQTKFV